MNTDSQNQSYIDLSAVNVNFNNELASILSLIDSANLFVVSNPDMGTQLKIILKQILTQVQYQQNEIQDLRQEIYDLKS